jgi:cell division inhibitor SepF
MASLWNKTLFYLGLVDEEEQPGVDPMDQGVGDVRPVADAAPAPQASPTSTVRPPGSGVSGRRVEPPATTRRTMSQVADHAEAGVYVHPNAGSYGGGDSQYRRSDPESKIIAARNFSDAQALADAIRTGRSVVLDLRGTEPEMVRRIVDFASGLTYALDGRMVKTTQGVILVTPSGVSIGVAEQERLAALGLYGSPS